MSFSDELKEPNLAAIVLCGGESQRMGYRKSQLMLGNESFLQRIVERVSTRANSVIVVGANDEESRIVKPGFNNLHFVQDEISHRGPLEGIRVGLKTLVRLDRSLHRAFVCGCDTPLISAGLVDGLFSLLTGFDAVVPRLGQQVYGTTAIYRTSVLSSIEEAVAQNRMRVQDWIKSLNSRFVSDVELTGIDPNLESFVNVNSPEDYLALLKRCGHECSPGILAQLGIQD